MRMNQTLSTFYILFTSLFFYVHYNFKALAKRVNFMLFLQSSLWLCVPGVSLRVLCDYCMCFSSHQS